jgi:hypothetical protein
MMFTTKDSLGGVIAVGMEVELIELPMGYFKDFPEAQAAAIKTDVGYSFQINGISESGLVTLNVRLNDLDNPTFDCTDRYLGDITVPGFSLKRIHRVTENDSVECQILDGKRTLIDIDGNSIFENSQVYLLSLPADYLYDYPDELDDNLMAQFYAQVGKLHTVTSITERNRVEIDFWHDDVIDLEDGSQLISSSNIALPGCYFRLKNY